MGQRWIPFTALATVLLAWAASPSFVAAGIIWDSGVLRAQSNVYNVFQPGSSVSDNPPDVIMTGPTASHSTSALIIAGASASAQTDITIGQSLHINAGSNFFYLVGSSSASASVSGTASFTATTTEYAQVTFSASTVRGSGRVTLKDPTDTTIATFSSSTFTPSPPNPLTFQLKPGLYTVQWNWGTQPFVGTGGQSGLQFHLSPGVPEPASLALLTLPAMLLVRRSRAA